MTTPETLVEDLRGRGSLDVVVESQLAALVVSPAPQSVVGLDAARVEPATHFGRPVLHFSSRHRSVLVGVRSSPKLPEPVPAPAPERVVELDATRVIVG